MTTYSLCRPGPFGVLGLMAVHFFSFASAAELAPEAPKHPFHDNVKVTMTQTHMLVESDGIPTHKTGEFPNADNPNRIIKQEYKFHIPLKPRVAEKPVKTPMGPIGVAVNGIPFFNQYNAHGQDAVKLEVFDSCCGHPDQLGRYHYHKYPVCIKSPFKDEPGKHSPLIGYAFDGFAIYGPNGEDGKPPADLDECNGHSDKEHGYHYHVTAKFPYILGAYKGVPDERNFRRPGLRPDGPPDGPPGDRRGPPPPFGPPPGGPRRPPPPPPPPPLGPGR